MGTIGEQLKWIRNRKGISQEELAEQIHMRRQTVSSYERGISTPDIYKLIAMADYLDVSLDELVGRKWEDKNQKTDSKYQVQMKHMWSGRKKEQSITNDD